MTVLLALSVVINYIDRSNLAIAAPLIREEIGLSASQLGLLLSALGDVFLMFEPVPGGPDWFVFGLASFLFAHVAYLVGLFTLVLNR